MNLDNNGFIDDIVSGTDTLVYDVFKRLESYSGQCMRIERDSDNTQTDIGFSNNYIDVSAIESFCSGTEGRVAEWYDQSTLSITGTTGSISQSTYSQMPIIYESGAVVTEPNTGIVMPRFVDSNNTTLTDSVSDGTWSGSIHFIVFNKSSSSSNGGFGFPEGTGSAKFVSLNLINASDINATWRYRDSTPDNMVASGLGYGDVYLSSMWHELTGRNIRINGVEEDSSTLTESTSITPDSVRLGDYRSSTNDTINGYIGSFISLRSNFEDLQSQIEDKINFDFQIY